MKNQDKRKIIINIRAPAKFVKRKKISHNDGFPEQICRKCLEEIKQAYNFKLKCEQSEASLKQLRLDKLEKKTIARRSGRLKRNSETLKQQSTTFLQTVCIKEELIIDDVSIEKIDHTEYLSEQESMHPLFYNDYMIDGDKSMNDCTPEFNIYDYSLNVFDNNNKLESDCEAAHIKDSTGDIKCLACPKKFSTSRKLKKHILTSHTKGKTCKICNIDVGYIWAHCNAHMPEYLKLKCTDCDKSFWSEAVLKAHERNMHSVLFTCSFCPRKCRDRKIFHDHVSEHTGLHENQCRVCSKIFQNRHLLQNHVLIHSVEKPFKCEICSKTFRQRVHLRVHTGLKHSDKMLYRCKHCSMEFRTWHRLKKHEFQHTGNNDLLCKVCLKVFATRLQAEIHMRTHTGEKPYRCEVCSTSFTYKTALKTHIKTEMHYTIIGKT